MIFNIKSLLWRRKQNDSQSSQKCFWNAVRSKSTNWEWTCKISFSFFFHGQKYRARGNSFKVPISSKVGSFYLFSRRISMITSQILSFYTFLLKRVWNSDDCDCIMEFVETQDMFHTRYIQTQRYMLYLLTALLVCSLAVTHMTYFL